MLTPNSIDDLTHVRKDVEKILNLIADLNAVYKIVGWPQTAMKIFKPRRRDNA